MKSTGSSTAGRKVMVNLNVQVWEETKRQLRDINATRSKGNKLTLSRVVTEMLAFWNKVPWAEQ